MILLRLMLKDRLILGEGEGCENVAEAPESFSESVFRLEFQLEGRHRNIPDEVPTSEGSFSAIPCLGYIDGGPNPILAEMPP